MPSGLRDRNWNELLDVLPWSNDGILSVKSGCQKRKEKPAREQKFEDAQKGQKTLTSFYSQKGPRSVESASGGSITIESNQNSSPIDQNLQPTNAASAESGNNDLSEKIHENNSTKEAMEFYNIENSKVDEDFHEEFLDPYQAEQVMRQGHQEMPLTFPLDRSEGPFPVTLLSKTLLNGEKKKGDWLVWSHKKLDFFYLPCRLLSKNTLQRSSLCRPNGYSTDLIWKKLYDKLPSHENNSDHVECYVQ
ncbi:zinc finger MYM-type protein 5-like [Ceratitis capitata]|uniref:zinc finger MYM-type protein 5-like n=1 Tax=Ceratitis capitata TaxID=7213 RepID=UPI000329A787|nr:zinc finger MYM-type protein 5-like [Ceratitis capitata]